MNQILENKKGKRINKSIIIIQFVLFLIVLSTLVFFLFYNKCSTYQNNKLSKATIQEYSLLNLYSKESNNLVVNKNKISILGTIVIPKIDIKYSILSNYSDDLLKISVCKFYGPNINTVGNFCILGHNYNNNDFFSKYYLLNIGDKIEIYDLNLFLVTYSIYDIYEIFPSNLDYISQQTNRQKRNNFNNM